MVTEGSDVKCELEKVRTEEVQVARKTSAKKAGSRAEASEPTEVVVIKKPNKAEDRRGRTRWILWSGVRSNVLIKQGRFRSERLVQRSRTIGIAPGASP